MRRSRIRAYVHIVWATRQRLPLISPEMEERLYRCIESESLKLKVKTLSIGGMPDHIHFVGTMPATCSFAELVRQLKGVSSRFVQTELLPGEFFEWQEGYGLFTLSKNHVEKAVTYVKNQKRHHTTDTVWPEWEETDEETLPPGVQQ
jgi:REP element-mobilizing transposase RayT